MKLFMEVVTKNIEISFFAQLTEFFPEKLDMEVEKQATVKEILDRLKEINPFAKSILQVSRVANTDQILSDNMKVDDQEILFILPPSSGG